MMRYWGAFAHQGSPSVKGAPVWPTYGPGQQVMQLRTAGASKVISTFEADHHCDFWLA
jgi:para-nitrobenzyl esterase